MSVLFVSGTGTGVGKTYVSRGLARAFSRRGLATAALKPIETGCDPYPLDALALARACGRPELAHAPGFFRARAPVAPYAAALGGEPPPPLTELVTSIETAALGSAVCLVEGAGGLLVPYDRDHVLVDVALRLRAQLVLVASDTLGTLSHTLAALEAARTRRLPIAALVLSQATVADASRATNRRILEERLGHPVLCLPVTPDDDDALADAVEQSGLAGRAYPT